MIDLVRERIFSVKSHRLARIAEVIRQAASETILFKLQDPRVKMVTVTRAEVSADLQHAKVYVSIMGSPKQQKLTMFGLTSATGFIQAEVAKRLQTRFTPAIRFYPDEGVKKSIEITRLIREGLGQSAADPALEESETDEDADDLDETQAGDSEPDESDLDEGHKKTQNEKDSPIEGGSGPFPPEGSGGNVHKHGGE
jgi:ribosome-binding factor A